MLMALSHVDLHKTGTFPLYTTGDSDQDQPQEKKCKSEIAV